MDLKKMLITLSRHLQRLQSHHRSLWCFFFSRITTVKLQTCKWLSKRD